MWFAEFRRGLGVGLWDLVSCITLLCVEADYVEHVLNNRRDIWAQQTSLNPDVKIFVGAPASTTAAGTGYQTPDVLAEYAVTTRNSFPSFGGVMMWDASQAYRECYA